MKQVIIMTQNTLQNWAESCAYMNKSTGGNPYAFTEHIAGDIITGSNNEIVQIEYDYAV